MPGKRSAAGQSRRVPRLCRMAADALSGLHYLAPGSPPSQARQAQRRRAIYPAPCRVCAGWRLTPYPAYVIWRRVRPLSRPGKRSAAGRSRRVPRLCRMAADALSDLRYLAPGSAPSQARQAQRRRAIYPAPCRVCAGWRLTPYPAYIIWRRVRPLSRPGKRSAAGRSRRVPRLCRMAADALSDLRNLKMDLYQMVIRDCRPGKRSAAGQSGWGVYAASRGM